MSYLFHHKALNEQCKISLLWSQEGSTRLHSDACELSPHPLIEFL